MNVNDKVQFLHQDHGKMAVILSERDENVYDIKFDDGKVVYAHKDHLKKVDYECFKIGDKVRITKGIMAGTTAVVAVELEGYENSYGIEVNGTLYKIDSYYLERL